MAPATADVGGVSTLLSRTQDIVDVASQSGMQDRESVIVLGVSGGMRMLDADGWTLDGLIGEFGAREVFRVKVRGGSVRVEGWSSGERCLVERKTPGERFAKLTGGGRAPGYTAMLCSA